jgi:hypothetical protein
MLLTLENKLEIVGYVSGISRYQETFNEVYDHIVMALESSDSSAFTISLVTEIIIADFGGREQIVADETAYEKAFVRTCMKNLRKELVGAFRLPAILLNASLLTVWYLLYQLMGMYPFGIKLIALSIFALAAVPLISNYFRRYLFNRTRKPSVKYIAINPILIFWLNFMTSISLFFLNPESIIQVSSSVRYLIAAGTFYMFSNCLVACFRVYKKRLRVLA